MRRAFLVPLILPLVAVALRAGAGRTRTRWVEGSPWTGVRVAGPEAGRPEWESPSREGAAVLELGDGRYWAIGGRDERGRPSNRTWLYRPVPWERKLRPPARHPGGLWTEGPRMHFPRAFPAVCLLADGRILVAGGFGRDGRPQRTVERIDPATGRCRRLCSMQSPRAAAAAARLRNGRILVIGGFRAPGRPTATLETFDPQLCHFQRHPWRLPEPAAYPAVCRLVDGDLLISGGWTGEKASDQVVLFDDIGAPVHPWQGVQRHPQARGGLHVVGHLEAPRAGHRMRRMGEVVLIAGGTQGDPCRPAPRPLPPEVWDTARPGPKAAFELVGPLDPRFPRRLPYGPGEPEEYLVGEPLPECPDLSPETPRGLDPCWIFPREARRASDGRIPRDGWLPLEGRPLWGTSDPDERLLPEPRDRVGPFPGTSRDPRPDSRPPGYPGLPLPASKE